MNTSILPDIGDYDMPAHKYQGAVIIATLILLLL